MKAKAKLRFPTKKEFFAWWEGKRDIYRSDRARSCPLARYLRAHGAKAPRISNCDWYDSGRTNWDWYPLPVWAQEALMKFDEKFDRKFEPCKPRARARKKK